MTNAPATRETADHAELRRIEDVADWFERGDPGANGSVLLSASVAAEHAKDLRFALSEIAALRGEVQNGHEHLEFEVHRADQAERQRDELRKATETAANLFKLCTEPTMFENASTLNVYAQMTEWLVRNRPLIANQGADHD